MSGNTETQIRIYISTNVFFFSKRERNVEKNDLHILVGEWIRKV